MLPKKVTVGPLAAAVANGVAASQSGTANTPLTLNGSLAANGMVIFDQPRRVIVTSAGNDSGIFFTIVGTNWSGQAITERLTGGNAGSVQTVLDYATIRSVTPSANTASTVTAGTSGVAGSAWLRLDDYGPTKISLQANVIGTVSGTIQATLDDPNSLQYPVAPSAVTWVNSADSAANNFSQTIQSNFDFYPCFIRVVLNSGTGAITLIALQPGSAGPS